MHGLAIHDEVIVEELAYFELIDPGFKPLKGLSEHFNVDFGFLWFLFFMGLLVVVMAVSVIGVLVEFALKMAGEGCAAIM